MKPMIGVASLAAQSWQAVNGMLRAFIIYYKYKCPGDKKPGAVKQYRIYASNYEEARQIATQHGSYPDIEVLSIKPA